MRLLTSVVLAICLMQVNGNGQRLEFEVSTVKVPAPVPFGQPIGINLGTFRNGTLTMTNVTLADCLQFAHALVSKEQVAGPDARRMLRSLLADRLKLTTRTEQRPFSFVALVEARNSLLSRLDGQLFVDKTGLAGRYQINLAWAPDNDTNRSGLSLSEALETQLGLRMERRREPLDVVVVEQAERVPSDS